MIKIFQKFLSRFRKPIHDPRHPRTMAESQLEDLESQAEDTEERKIYDEATYEGRIEALRHGFGTSTHSGDNPFREKI